MDNDVRKNKQKKKKRMHEGTKDRWTRESV